MHRKKTERVIISHKSVKFNNRLSPIFKYLSLSTNYLFADVVMGLIRQISRRTIRNIIQNVFPPVWLLMVYNLDVLSVARD